MTIEQLPRQEKPDSTMQETTTTETKQGKLLLSTEKIIETWLKEDQTKFHVSLTRLKAV